MGTFINWTTFWEQFTTSIHDRTNLSDSEKVAYLKHALKDGPAKHVIDGLSGSGDHYSEAIECLRKQYDRPRLIQQANVRVILDAQAIKDGCGKELQQLHDVITQHLSALRAMDYDIPGHFITSVLELKLDTNTMFEWLKMAQNESFPEEIIALKNDTEVPRSGCLSSLCPFLDSHGIVRVSGRGAQLKLAYDTCNPMVLWGKHAVTTLLICTEHLRLLHAGPTLVAASLHRRFHITGSRVIIRAIVRECVVSRRTSTRPRPQMLGQLPVDQLLYDNLSLVVKSLQ